MQAAEFKAWFDGFAAAAGDGLTREQWAAFKQKVAEIEAGSPRGSLADPKPLVVYRAPPETAAAPRGTWFSRYGTVVYPKGLRWSGLSVYEDAEQAARMTS